MMDTQHPLLSGIVELDETFGGAPPRVQASADTYTAPRSETTPVEDTGHDDDRSDDGTPPPPPSSGTPSHPKGRGTKRPMVLLAVERAATHPEQSVAKRLTIAMLTDSESASTHAYLSPNSGVCA